MAFFVVMLLNVFQCNARGVIEKWAVAKTMFLLNDFQFIFGDIG